MQETTIGMTLCSTLITNASYDRAMSTVLHHTMNSEVGKDKVSRVVGVAATWHNKKVGKAMNVSAYM